MSFHKSSGINNRSDDQGRDRSIRSGPGGIIHAPKRATFKGPYEWLLASVFYFLAGPIFSLAAFISLKGWHGYLIAIALLSLWLWLVVVRGAARTLGRYQQYRCIDGGRNWFVLRTNWKQREYFIDAGLSVPWSDTKRKPRTPTIISYGPHVLGIFCRVEILSGQSPQMFLDAAELLSRAFDEELEIRRVDHRHIDMIFTIIDPLEDTRIADFNSNGSIFSDIDELEPPTTTDGLW